MWQFIIPAAASILGGKMGADAAEDAANTQSAAADRASAAQERIADKQIGFQREAIDRQIGLQEPFRNIGLRAQNQLAYLLGLSDPGLSQSGDGNINAIRRKYEQQFTFRDPVGGGLLIDYDKVNAAVKDELSRPGAAPGQGGEYGSLMRDFTDPVPEIGAFTLKDFQREPGHEFVRSEGEQALTRAAAAAGRLNSGRYLKDAMRFNTGLASQEFGNAFNRHQVQGANRVNAWKDRFNAFQTNRANKLNPLQSLAGVGQTAANTMGQSYANFANSSGNALGQYGQALDQNITGAGNAMAAGRVGGANSWNNAIGQGLSMYQQQNMLNRFFPQAGGGGMSPPNPYASGFGVGSDYMDGPFS